MILVKKISVLLCSVGIACVLSGCGEVVPDLTEEETEIITEYAVGVLLKYDKYYNDRLVDLAAYEETADSNKEDEPSEEDIAEPQPEQDEPPIADTEVVDVSEEKTASSIEEFYGIGGFSFQYTGYELKNEYPDMTDNEAEAFFAMQATAGTQLLVMKFQVMNNSGMEQELNMFNYGMKSRISVNDEAAKSALSTMLLNDLQTYKGVIGANESTELVAVIEVPEGTYVENLAIQLRNDSDSATISLQ